MSFGRTVIAYKNGCSLEDHIARDYSSISQTPFHPVSDKLNRFLFIILSMAGKASKSLVLRNYSAKMLHQL